MSGDGTKIALCSFDTGVVYVSTNSGSSWANVTPPGGVPSWYSVASSTDWETLAVSESHGYVYVSYDGGTTWSHSTVDSNFYKWLSLSANASGTVIIGGATTDGANVHISVDAGASWSGRRVSNSKILVVYIDNVKSIYLIGDVSSAFSVAMNALESTIGSDTQGSDYIGDMADLLRCHDASI